MHLLRAIAAVLVLSGLAFGESVGDVRAALPTIHLNQVSNPNDTVLDKPHTASVAASSCDGGFPVGTVFASDGISGHILKLNHDGSSVDPWVILPSYQTAGTFFQDRFCAFGGDLIVATSDQNAFSDVWRVKPDGSYMLVVHLDQRLEAITTLPNDPVVYGPLAGRILAAAAPRTSATDDPGARIYAIAADGSYVTIGGPSGANTYPTAAFRNIEAILVVRKDAELYGATADLGLVKAPAADFATMCGHVLMAGQFAAGTSGLFDLVWNPLANGGAGSVDITPLTSTLDGASGRAPHNWKKLEWFGGNDCAPASTSIAVEHAVDDVHADGSDSAAAMSGEKVFGAFESDPRAAGSSSVPVMGSVRAAGDAPPADFWQSKNGQAVVGCLNGGPNSTKLATWLSTNFPFLSGAGSSTNLTGKANSDVAAVFSFLFNTETPNVRAQTMAVALASYVTSKTLSDGVNCGAMFGFSFSTNGTGIKGTNVGSLGTAIGLLNNTTYSVLQLLQQANLKAKSGPLDAAFNDIFTGINELGHIE